MKKSEAGYRVALVGATGAVGREMIRVLEDIVSFIFDSSQTSNK